MPCPRQIGHQFAFPYPRHCIGFPRLHHQLAHCNDAVHDPHESVLLCHAQQGLGDATGMLQPMVMNEVLPVVVRIALHGAALLAALPPLGGGILYCLGVD